MPGKLTAVVLAAGRSRRMGRQKLLLPFGNKFVLQQVLDALSVAEPDRVLVVLGPTGGPVAASFADSPLSIVWNRKPESEMVDSLRCVLPHLPVDGEGVLVCLGDQPMISPATYRSLALQHRRQPEAILQPRTASRKGHPVLLPQALFREILSRPSLRDLLRTYEEKTRLIEVEDPGILLDMDTPKDYRTQLRLWEETCHCEENDSGG